MSIQGIKNAKLRKTVLVVFGPPLVIGVVIYEVLKVLHEAFTTLPGALKDAWNG